MAELAAQSASTAFLVLLGGLGLLLFSAKYFVDSMAELATAAGVSPLVVGMTVVAFGTSTPELVVNGFAAARGETALAFGNIVGSCTVNIGFVLALTALIRPLRVEPSLITREIPMMIVAVCALVILGADLRLKRAAGDSWDRADGLILLLLFAIFLYYTAIYSLAQRLVAGAPADAFLEEVAEAEQGRKATPSGRLVLVALASLAGVLVSASWAVDGATSIARFLGMSDNLVGLTVVSLGTTFPELATCILAARRGNADIALGNVVGSNLFNILAIGGAVSAIRPVALPPGGWLDLAFMAALSVVLLPIAIRSGQTITRGEGAFLLAVYLAFLGWRLTAA